MVRKGGSRGVNNRTIFVLFTDYLNKVGCINRNEYTVRSTPYFVYSRKSSGRLGCIPMVV